MKIHLAGPDKRLKEVAYDTGVPWVMTSWYYHRDSPTNGSGEEWVLDYRAHPNCKGLIVDSGAFSYINAGSTKDADEVDWHAYAESYAEWVRDNEIERWIELDLDGPKSYDFALELRELMEDIVGRPCIPVWHRSRGADAFRAMCDEYDRVAMGGFPWNEIGPAEYHVLPSFINEAHKRGARIHGLGFQPRADLLNKYPFDSTDSANWVYACYGVHWDFDGTKLVYKNTDRLTKPELAIRNLREWVKFARYMDGRNEPAIGVEW